MILLVHLLMGAAIGQTIQNPALALALSLASHYFLDFFPHVEYPISNIEKKQWLKAIPEFLSVVIDFSAGIMLIFLLSSNRPIIYACAIVAIVPDALSVLTRIINSGLLKKHSNFHQEKIHYFRNKKVSISWRIASQAIAVAAAVVLLHF